MKSEELNKFAQQLKTTREEASITLEQISSKSRIDIKFLRAIEEGDFDVLPEVYIKAFIKQYAVQVNLSPDEVINNYESAKRGRLKSTRDITQEEKAESAVQHQPEVKAADEEAKVIEEPKPKKKEFGVDDAASHSSSSSEKGSSVNMKYVLIGVIVAAIIVAAYFIFINGSNDGIIKETPFEDVIQEKSEPKQEEDGNRFEVAKDNPTQPVKEIPKSFMGKSDSLSLGILVSDTCWISAEIDNGTKSREFLLYPQNSAIVKAVRSFKLILGNSGGVTLYLNGKKLDLGETAGRKVLSINGTGIVNNSN